MSRYVESKKVIISRGAKITAVDIDIAPRGDVTKPKVRRQVQPVVEPYTVDTSAKRFRGFVPIRIERRPGVFVTYQVHEKLIKLAHDLDLVVADPKTSVFEKKHALHGAKMIRSGVPLDAPNPDGTASHTMWAFYNAIVVRRDRRLRIEAMRAEKR